MDQQKLRSLVFEKTGVKIDIDDPIFALVALNEAVLAEAVERHVALLDEATRELAVQASALQAAPASASRKRSSKSAEAPPPAPPLQEKRLIAIAGSAAVLCALLVLIGQAMFFKPPAIPAPVVQARELTPEQSAAIRNHEKLNKVIQKLDQKTRATITTEMQKP
jgi:hypothetical protein